MYIIKSYEGFDNISFGMSPDEVKTELKREPKKFYKIVDDAHASDDYGDFFVYYNEHCLCEAIEFNKYAKVKFKNIILFDLEYKELEKRIIQFDNNLEIDETGFISNKLGIGVYIIDKDCNTPVDSVIIFEKGYYQ